MTETEELQAIVDNDEMPIEIRKEAAERILEAKSEAEVPVPPMSDEYYYYTLQSAFSREQVAVLRELGRGTDAFKAKYKEFQAESEQRAEAVKAAREVLKTECAARGIVFDVGIYEFAMKRINSANPHRTCTRPITSLTFDAYVEAARALIGKTYKPFISDYLAKTQQSSVPAKEQPKEVVPAPAYDPARSVPAGYVGRTGMVTAPQIPVANTTATAAAPKADSEEAYDANRRVLSRLLEGVPDGADIETREVRVDDLGDVGSDLDKLIASLPPLKDGSEEE